jgi:N utilization substance protein B
MAVGRAPEENAGRAERQALSTARLAAVQAIYQMEMGGTEADTVISEFVHVRGGAELDQGDLAVGEGRPEADRALLGELVRGAAEHRTELDGMISGLLVEGWPIERIEKVMVAILRAGAFELLYRPSVPARVVISEYVDVAHAFFDAKEAGMVNGVLDRMARNLRGAEMDRDGRAAHKPE